MSKSRKLKTTKRRSLKKGGKPLRSYDMPVEIIASFDDEMDEMVLLPENTSSVTVKTFEKVDPMSDARIMFNSSIEEQIAKEEGIKNLRSENLRTIRLARQGDSHFQNACGYFYYLGNWPGAREGDKPSPDTPSPPQNYNKAFYWFQLAANNFVEHDAQFYLAEMYELGRGTDQNWDNALFWYNLSAQSGNEKAIERLKEYKKNPVFSIFTLDRR